MDDGKAVPLPEKAKATLDGVALQPETVPATKDGISGLFNGARLAAVGQENRMWALPPRRGCF